MSILDEEYDVVADNKAAHYAKQTATAAHIADILSRKAYSGWYYALIKFHCVEDIQFGKSYTKSAEIKVSEDRQGMIDEIMDLYKSIITRETITHLGVRPIVYIDKHFSSGHNCDTWGTPFPRRHNW